MTKQMDGFQGMAKTFFVLFVFASIYSIYKVDLLDVGLSLLLAVIWWLLSEEE